MQTSIFAWFFRRKKRTKKRTARNDARNGSATSLDSFNYPYPRTHTTMMVIPSRRPYAPEDDPAINSFTTSYPNPSINFITSMNSENGNAYVRPRPPLNRSCPPIPESRSNESIMTHASSAVESLPTPSSTVADKCVIIGNPMATHGGIPKSVSQQSIKSIKNSSLPSPSTSAAPSIMTNNNNNNINGRPNGSQQLRFAPRPPVKRQHVEPPRSPLMSVAHSVRNSLSKLGNRLSSTRGESPHKEGGGASTSNIKNSRSMSSMPSKNSKSKLPKLVTDQNDNLRSLHKSSSMEAPPRSTSSDSLKQIIANKRGERITKPSSLPLPRYPSSSSSTRFPVRNLDTIISEVSEEQSRMESIKCEKLKKTREADEVSVPTPPSYDLKDLVSRFVDDSTLATAEIRQGSWANVVEPDEITIAEEIPMDTNPTPDDATTINDDEDQDERVEDIKEEVLIGDDSITVVREEHCTRKVAPPIFVAPAPPRLSPAEEQQLLAVEEQTQDEQPKSSGESSDSTVKENCNIIYIRKVDENGVQRVETIPNRRDSSKIKKERERERKEFEKMQKKEKEKEKEREKEWLKEKEKEKEKEKGQRTPLSTRSIKQFLLRRPSEKREKKTPPMSRSMMTLSPASRPRLALPFHHPRFAPLVEMESTVVENSPAVEIAPGKWGKPSPKILRRNSECSVHDLIKEAGRQEALLALRGDDNGNVTVSPRIATVEEQKGLIDDEILDQPMLMGDSFPTSESLNRISQHIDSSQMGIDLSPIDRTESRHSHQSRSDHSQHSQHFTQPSPSNHLANSFNAAAIRKDEQEKIQVINEGLSEVDDLRAQLMSLKQMIMHEDKFEETSVSDLVRENDALRRQLMEKDSVINMLRTQLTSLKMPSSVDS